MLDVKRLIVILCSIVIVSLFLVSCQKESEVSKESQSLVGEAAYTPGTAKVYENNPISTPTLKIVQLNHLQNNGYLQGTYVKKVKNAISGEKDTYSTNNVFVFSPTEEKNYGGGKVGPYEGVRFGETMAYYCSDKFLAYVAEKKYNSGKFQVPKVQIKVYNKDVEGSGFYDGTYINIGVPVNGLDPNKNCPTFVHELTHFLFDKNYPEHLDVAPPDEERLLNEGLALFMATSFQDVLFQNNEESTQSLYLTPSYNLSNEFLIDDNFDCENRGGVCVSKGQGVPPCNNGGCLDGCKNCKEDCVPRCEYDYRAMAGIFWDIRKVLGKEKTHKLIFKSWEKLPKQCEELTGENYLVDVFLALDAAENELYNKPNYHKAIKNAFTKHSQYFKDHQDSLPWVVPNCK